MHLAKLTGRQKGRLACSQAGRQAFSQTGKTGIQTSCMADRQIGIPPGRQTFSHKGWHSNNSPQAKRQTGIPPGRSEAHRHSDNLAGRQKSGS